MLMSGSAGGGEVAGVDAQVRRVVQQPAVAPLGLIATAVDGGESEVVVGHLVAEHVPYRGEDLVAGSDERPSRSAALDHPRVGAVAVGVLGSRGGCGASPRAPSHQRLPTVVFPARFLPADTLFPGSCCGPAG